MRNGAFLIGFVTEDHLHLITDPAHAGVTDLLGAQLGAEILHHLLLLLGQCFGHVHFHQEVHTTAQIKTQLQRRRTDGFEPGGSGRCQVECGNEVVAQLVGNDIARLQLVFGVLETDQDKTVLECSMFDRDLGRFKGLFHQIKSI